MWKANLILLGFISFMLACTNSKVIGFLADNIDFNEYRTYRLVNYQTENTSYSNEGEDLFAHIEAEIEFQMGQKGFVKHSESDDLVVGYEIMTTIEADAPSSYCNPYGLFVDDPSSLYVTQGLVLVEFKDINKDKVVWQASSDLKYSKSSTPKSILNETIIRIFESYPYESGEERFVLK